MRDNSDKGHVLGEEGVDRVLIKCRGFHRAGKTISPHFLRCLRKINAGTTCWSDRVIAQAQRVVRGLRNEDVLIESRWRRGNVLPFRNIISSVDSHAKARVGRNVRRWSEVVNRAGRVGTMAVAIDYVRAGHVSTGVRTPTSHFEVLEWRSRVIQRLVVGIVRDGFGECPVGKADSIIGVAINFRRGQKF